ncbi:hypothetical protein M9980_10765 [Sphingomonas donggukensis]|uniref:Uncharacterized protein n=1 Tax=Sphingomonas donggukensis TaxID=2949093 RepID=A0ABY4TRK9_9SPHN|nr:hypothetical protein [Sphingomonas donggukensis]URW75038.1 hypothetical protein M9980_10765 [Sphingomonas donggukensis]
MPIRPEAFDTPLHYTTAWCLPHHNELDFGRRNIGWEDTVAGRAVYNELSARGLSEADIGLFAGDEIIAVTPPAPLATAGPTILRSDTDPTNRSDLRLTLDLTLANLARETMMSAARQPQGGELPAWTLLTTPITEQLLRLNKTSSYQIWQDAAWDTEIEITGDARRVLQHRLSRVGPVLLTTSCELAPDLTIGQDRETYLMVGAKRCLGAVEAAAGSTLGEVVDLTGVPLAEYLGSLEVKRASPCSDGTGIIATVSMPVCTMAPIPALALEHFGFNSYTDEEARLPLWTLVKRVPEWVPPFPASTKQAAPPSNPAILTTIEPNGGPITDVVTRAVDKQPEARREQVREVVLSYVAFRHLHGDGPSDIFTESAFHGRVKVADFLNTRQSERAQMSIHLRSAGDIADRVRVAAELAPTVRALRVFYAELNFAGICSESPLDSKQWDEPPGFGPIPRNAAGHAASFANSLINGNI